MSKIITSGSPLRDLIIPKDTNNQPLEADTPPTTMVVKVNNVVVAGTGLIGDWDDGYLVTFTPTTPFTAGQVVSLEMDLVFDSFTEPYHEIFTIISASGLVYTTPASEGDDSVIGDTINVFVGDDHASDTPRQAFRWKLVGVDLTGATAQFTIWKGSHENDYVVQNTATFGDLGDATQYVEAGLTNAESVLLVVGQEYNFQVAVTLASTKKWTPVSGTFSPRYVRK